MKDLELALGDDAASLRRNDAGGDGFLQAEGTANRDHPVAHLHAVGITQLGGGQRLADIDFDDSEIGFLIAADDLGVVRDAWRIVLKLHPNAIGLFDHVAIGKDVALSDRQ